MFLSNPSAVSVIKKQFHYKRDAYIDHFFSLIVFQLFALLISFAGTGGSGTGSETVSLNITLYSANVVISLTLLWAFITGITLTTKTYRYDDFAFVTNRLTSNISSSFFLLFASIFAGLSAMLSSFLLKILLHFFSNKEIFMDFGLLEYYKEFLLGVGVTILYALLLSALGYLIGSLVQWKKIFAFIIPALFFLLLMRSETGSFNVTEDVLKFYIQESSILLFTVKVVSTVIVFFASATILSNRLEVRR